MMSLTICRMEIMGCTQIDFFQLKKPHYEVQKHITQSLNSANRQTDKSYLPSQLIKAHFIKTFLIEQETIICKTTTAQLSSAQLSCRLDLDQNLQLLQLSILCLQQSTDIAPSSTNYTKERERVGGPYFFRKLGDGQEQVQQHKTHSSAHTHKHTKCPWKREDLED